MKLSIRMKIFLPVMLLLIAFPVAAWFVFSYALDGDPEPCFFVQGKRREIVTGDLKENRAFMIRRTGAG